MKTGQNFTVSIYRSYQLVFSLEDSVGNPVTTTYLTASFLMTDSAGATITKSTASGTITMSGATVLIVLTASELSSLEEPCTYSLTVDGEVVATGAATLDDTLMVWIVSRNGSVPPELAEEWQGNTSVPLEASFANPYGEWTAGGRIARADVLGVFQAVNATDFESSLLNLATPGIHNAIYGIVGPNWDAVNGWDNVAGYINSNLIPDTDGIVSMIFRYVTAAGICPVSAYVPGYFGINHVNQPCNGGYASAVALPASGVFTIAGQKAFINKAQVDVIPAGGLPAVPVYLFANDNNGNAGWITPAKIAAIAFYKVDVAPYISELVDWINGCDTDTPAGGVAYENFLTIGDSKTVEVSTDGIWPTKLAFAANKSKFPRQIAAGGRSTATLQSIIDAELASRTETPKYILYNMGRNDSGSHATWQAQTNYILDALHTKWPSAQIFIHRVWCRDAVQKAWCEIMDTTDIPAVLTGRGAYATVGPDERIWLEGGDDGATMSSDGTHYSTAGQNECVSQWRTVLGI